MTVLPIVERELRVTARKRGTYWGRVLNAFLAGLFFYECYAVSAIDPGLSFVQALFWGLSGLCMLYCLAAGRLMTADCLSREKREGTFGLLFLTDLNGFDVVLGKLAASSLRGFYGLLAIVPILSLPLLTGGLTAGEFWRMALVLVNTFLFTGAIGLCASAINIDEQKAKGANLAILLGLAGLPPAMERLVESLIPGFKFEPSFFYTCPVFSFFRSAAIQYKLAPKDYWFSIGLTFALTLLLLLAACIRAPRSWQDKPIAARAPGGRAKPKRRPRLEGNASRAAAFRKRALDRNAYFWRAATPYFRAWRVWMAIGGLASLWAIANHESGGIQEEANVVFALLINVLLKWWVAVEAGRSLAADKRSGAFELLLSTPLSVRDILRGQRLALRRQFLKPLVAAVAAELAVALLFPHNDKQTRWTWVAGALMLAADVIALGWLAMLNGLSAKSHGRATLKSAVCIMVLPWILFGGAEIAARLFMFLFFQPMWDPGWQFDLGCWFVTGMAADLFFGLRARQMFIRRFRELALQPLLPRRRFAWLRDWWTGSTERKAELWRKMRRLGVVTASLLIFAASAIVLDIHLTHISMPQPLTYAASRNDATVQVCPAGNGSGFLFILPNGSLWSWGQRDDISPPLRIGTNQDWWQVSVSTSAVGLRANGTIWVWRSDAEQPKQLGSNQDWVSVQANNTSTLALNRDGRMRTWTNVLANNDRGAWVGTETNWRAIRTSPAGREMMAMKGDGTIWTWGYIQYSTAGMWAGTNYAFPVQFCKESNWVELLGASQCCIRSQSGQLWSLYPVKGLPDPRNPISSIGHQVSSNAAMIAFGPQFTSNWIYARYELHAEGTLWTMPENQRWSLPTAYATNEALTRFGRRSDWIGVWNTSDTMIGLTSDGTIWTWGQDFGQEPHWPQVFEERIDLIRAIARQVVGLNARGGSPIYFLGTDHYAQKEPRPLMERERPR